ncbi:MAG: hypothetical protein JXC36_06610 [Candidatus Atribacteria bacterium]|nr:hypothetical protein [Candidatus Atribacteria bacterium]
MNQTEQKPRRFSVPGMIYVSWTGLIVFFCFVVIPLASIGHSGGEQVPLTFLAYAIGPAIWGYFVISIMTSIVFKKWFKTYWIINLIVFLITGLILWSYYF